MLPSPVRQFFLFNGTGQRSNKGRIRKRQKESERQKQEHMDEHAVKDVFSCFFEYCLRQDGARYYRVTGLLSYEARNYGKKKDQER